MINQDNKASLEIDDSKNEKTNERKKIFVALTWML